MSINKLNNFPSPQKLLNPREPFYLFDIGARRGFHTVFNNFKPIIKIGFEPEKDDCAYELINFLSDKELISQKEQYKLKKLFLRRPFKNKLLNFIYNNLKFQFLPKSLRKFIRRYI
ncbi:hypothetical protein [Winogradskyella sp.]|uniref:hypothetical protein n=1 Tax=Winogradskyella sp. TaxID=1883156 RepID=UPI003F69A189